MDQHRYLHGQYLLFTVEKMERGHRYSAVLLQNLHSFSQIFIMALCLSFKRSAESAGTGWLFVDCDLLTDAKHRSFHSPAIFLQMQLVLSELA